MNNKFYILPAQAVGRDVNCNHCYATGKILVYGKEGSWEEPCSYCTPKATP